VIERAQQGRAGTPINIRYDGATEGTQWRLLDAKGKIIEGDPEVASNGEASELRPATDLPEGDLQLEVTLSSGATVRTTLKIDRTPPRITITRLSDSRALEAVESVSALDRFVIALPDEPGLTLIAEDGASVPLGQPISADDLPGPSSVLVAFDPAGNRTAVRADISLGETSTPRLSLVTEVTDTDPSSAANASDEPRSDGDNDTGGEVPLLLVLAAIALLLGVLSLYVLRRRR
jgi:LPXTG-motif cell wall-anchored protein